MIPQNGVDMEVKYRMTYGKHLLARNRSLQAIMEFESAWSLDYYKHYHSYCDSLAVHEKELQLNKIIREM